MRVNVESISEKITEKISKELNYDEDRSGIIKYGVFSFLQIVLSILIIIVLGFVFNLLVESLIVSFTISILRKSSGGAHSETPEKCLLIGTVATMLLAYISKILVLNFEYIIYLGVLIILISFILISKLAPVGNENKPINSVKKRKRLKRNSILILIWYSITIILSLIGYNKTLDTSMLVYSMCICLGVGWQTFSLTRIGHLFSKKIDALL